ncbi:MAG TPA: DUF4268 domain-containing protein [Flavisolibacter sp.]|nr:DUF4268 domain-containing protein [Flavisolibacter sp.]
MYSRQEASQLRQAFWTSFGQYMMPVSSAEGEKVNWVNYKTGEKAIAFRMEADNKKASIAIELSQKDPDIQQLYFEQFSQLRKMLEESTGEEWTWSLLGQDEFGRPLSRIYRELPGVSIFRKEDWPEMISFFKPRIIALDAFWTSAKYSFEMLR